MLYGIDLLLDVYSHDPHRCTGFKKIALPCSRELWNPLPGTDWGRKYRQSRSGHEKHTHTPLSIEAVQKTLSYQVAPDDEQEPLQLSIDRGTVADWCHGVDELGVLIWMAVALQTKVQ